MGVLRRVGRYEIVAPLAGGGMAEILLARVVGPHGFDRPAVVKRILPHLAQNPTFVAMFLDEARIVANIRHPNVVQVDELGEHDGELYLAMEYLEGESVGALLGRMLLRGQSIDAGLAAHIVAEACAGLHAAHELTDGSGTKQNLVHRDVSPQNVFLTYDGDVKLLDFGVAKVKDRLCQTEVGEIKGKFGYMSPEQCRGMELDRRSDIFSLGIVFFETLCGRRLFKRDNGLVAMKAICSSAIPALREVAPGCPEGLEAICMRALSRDRSTRYGTALDMRRDLLAEVRRLVPNREPREALAALMRECFGERMEEKREMLRRVRSGSSITSVPCAYDLLGDMPALEGQADLALDTVADTPRRRVRWTTLGGAALAALVGIALVANRSSGAHDDARRTVPALSSTPIAQPPEPLPSAPLSAQEITLRVESVPESARVSIEGIERGATPIDVVLRRSDQPVFVVVKRPGFKPINHSVVPSVHQRIWLTLVADTPSPSRGARQKDATPAASTAAMPTSPAPTPSAGFRRFN